MDLQNSLTTQTRHHPLHTLPVELPTGLLVQFPIAPRQQHQQIVPARAAVHMRNLESNNGTLCFEFKWQKWVPAINVHTPLRPFAPEIKGACTHRVETRLTWLGLHLAVHTYLGPQCKVQGPKLTLHHKNFPQMHKWRELGSRRWQTFPTTARGNMLILRRSKWVSLWNTAQSYPERNCIA